MISNIRNYINKTVKSIDSDLKPVDYVLNGEVADTKLENKFAVIFGNLSSERQDTHINSVISLTVEFWKNGYNKEIENFDKNYCKAIDIQARAMNQKLFHAHGGIESVNSSGVEVESVLSNDNLFKYTIQLTVTVSYIDI